MIKMKIKYEPFEEIIVKDYVKFEKLDDFVYSVAQLRALGQPVSLNWAEGVVFTHTVVQPITDELEGEFLKGRLYLVSVSFALMNQYQTTVTYKSSQGEIAVPIINVSSSKMLSELACWLKTQS